MRLRIEHTTAFHYDQPISEAYTEMRLRPLSANGQLCLSFTLTTEPRDEILQHTDRFGNDVRHFDVLLLHQRLVVTAVSEVLTPITFAPEAEPLSPLDEFDYLTPTRYAPIADDIVQFARAHVTPGDSNTSALALMHALFSTLKYEKGATDVSTAADRALALGRGVCQDFAHIMIAACRCQGLPARYVSGYLFSRGHDVASHAWVDVYVPDRGWLSLDPTHDQAQTEQYVRVAIGRDYADVPPTRGIFKGNAKESMDVKVAIAAI